MSRSSYNERTTTTSSGPVYDRDYDERKERERERTRNADRYDAETSRHHGKWTAQGEVDDLDSATLPGAYRDARRSAHLGNRSYSDREHYDRDYYRGSRSASNYNSYDNYGGSYNTAGYDQSYGGYGQIPNPPPMPPRDFWRTHGGYRSSHPYYPQYGHSSFEGSNFAGMNPQGYHHSFQSTGNFAQDIRQHAPELMHSLQGGYGGYGYDEGYGSRSLGSDYGFGGFGYGGYGMSPAYGHQSYEYLTGGYPYDDIYLSRGLGSRHLELGTTRPHVDIYELGNEYIIELDLPGHTRDHIETKLFGNELVITSRPPKRDFVYHINERSLGKHEVTRKFFLPSDVTASKIGATLTNGVLRVVLPRGAAVTTQPSTTTIVDTTGTTTTTTQATTV